MKGKAKEIKKSDGKENDERCACEERESTSSDIYLK